MKKLAFIIGFLILNYYGLSASEPQIKSFTKQSDFEEGEAKGISITSEGELQLAPEIVELIDSKENSVWAIAVDKTGNIFFSAGNEGKIYQLDKKRNLKLLCQLPEFAIYSLEFNRTQTLFAASSPNGKIYRIASDGQFSIFYDPPDNYIWEVLFDLSDNMYVATGDSGNIYKVTSDGQSNLFYDSDEPQIRCLAWDKSGNILARSFSNGYIYRINPSGEAFVIYDSNLQEIFQIEVAEDGTIYAAGLSQPSAIASILPEEKTESKKIEETAKDETIDGEIIIGEITIEAPRTTKPSRETVTQCAILKIAPNGIIKNIWDFYREPVQSMILINKKILLTGSGKSGKLIQFTADEEKTILMGLDESQISAFCKDENNNVIIATSNLGKLYKLHKNYRNSGFYLSEVIDTYTTSKWGSIRWDQEQVKGSNIKFFTRSGNTDKPNSTWSKWSSAITRNEGQNITSPDARFCQWKLELNTDNGNATPKISTVNLSYLQKNLPPDIFNITILPPGEYYQRALKSIDNDGSSNSESISFEREANNFQSNKNNHMLGRKSFQKGYRTISWDVIDENNDRLMFHLFYKEIQNRNWKKLAINWQMTSYSWDSERLPDGSYTIKILATDSLSNPDSYSFTSEKISDTFDIDNSGPQILNLSVANQNLSFLIVDEFNPIKEVYYSIDGADWKLAYPVDNICDSKSEEFSITINQPSHGSSHTIVVKAADSLGNLSFNRKTF